MQSSLTNLLLYASQVRKTLAESQSTGCDESNWRVVAANNARAIPQKQAIAIATERRKIIERFEDALDNIAQIAAEK